LHGRCYLVEKQGDICTISLNRPDRNHGVNLELFAHLSDAINSVNKDKEIRVVILRGSGDRVFSTGGDLRDEVSKGRRPEELRDLIYYFRDAIENTSELIESCRCPVIAMIYGDCLNAGCHLAVSCDFRVASDISRFSMYTVLVGTVFQYQAVQRFINVMGMNNAKELLYTARIIDAQKAKEWGLVNYVVPKKDVYSTTMSLAKEIAEKAPLAVSGTKATISQIFKYQQRPSPKDKADFEELLGISVNSEDAKEGNKAFVEGRKPHFIGK
jgi:enoyl-CoA hydratase